MLAFRGVEDSVCVCVRVVVCVCVTGRERELLLSYRLHQGCGELYQCVSARTHVCVCMCVCETWGQRGPCATIVSMHDCLASVNPLPQHTRAHTHTVTHHYPTASPPWSLTPALPRSARHTP